MKKYTLVLFIFAFVLLNFNIKFASANDSGCIGAAFSSTTGAPCDMTPSVTPNPDPAWTRPSDCISDSGFSPSTGASCNNSTSILAPTYPEVLTITLPRGCTSSMGYSSTTGAPCDTTPGYPSGCLLNTGYSTTTGLACNGTANASATNFDSFQVSGYRVHGCAGGYNHVATKDDCLYTVNGSDSGKLYTYTQISNFIKNGCTSDSGYSTTTGMSCENQPMVSNECTSGFGCGTASINATPTMPITTPVPVVTPVPAPVSSPTSVSASTSVNTNPVSTNTSPTTSTSIPAYTPPTAPLSTCTITGILRIGSTGNDVACLQSHIGLTADGKFGPKTQMAVRAFQAKMKLKADGVFGPRSVTALEINN